MHTDKDALLEILLSCPPQKLIPVIEKGLEIEKLEHRANPCDQETSDCILYSRALLTFLYGRMLGL